MKVFSSILLKYLDDTERNMEKQKAYNEKLQGRNARLTVLVYEVNGRFDDSNEWEMDDHFPMYSLSGFPD